jgi:hypothetical protein
MVVPRLQVAGRKQGNLGRPLTPESEEQRVNVQHKQVSARNIGYGHLLQT